MTSLVAIEIELLANVQGGADCTVAQLAGLSQADAAAKHMRCISERLTGANLPPFGTPPGTSGPWVQRS